jgi:hypothetical protein
MSLYGLLPGPFGIQKRLVLVASCGSQTAEGPYVQLYQGYLDASNRHYNEILRVVHETGLAKPMLKPDGFPRTKRVGSYTFTLYQFDRQKLMQYDPQDCQRYEHEFKMNIVRMNLRGQVNQYMQNNLR